MNEMVGRRLGEYQILRQIGSGGMANVYAAREMKLQRDVALKILRTDAGPQDKVADDSNLKRFQREAQAAARLNHPSIVQVYEFGEVDGVHYIAQELVDGINLKQAIERDGVCDAAQAIEILRCVAGALQVAHDAGVMHRDIKPENIMRGGDDAIKVTDFGLARMLTQVDTSTANLTRAGLTLGTPRYMSPEQIQGHKVDARSDLYSLGVTMYHLLTGSPPFDADEPIALAVKHINDTPRPLDHARGSSDLPPWLVSLVMQCLQKSPDSRFPSADALLAVIDRHTGGDIEAGSRSQPLPGVPTTQSPESAKHSKPSTIGVSGTTVQLQRVIDEAIGRADADRRRQRWFYAVVVATSIIGAVAGFLTARHRGSNSIASELRGPNVAQAATISQQYLIALTRNDVPGWTAVSDFFPADEDASRVDYQSKAKLQLARLWIDQGKDAKASELLDQVERSPSVKRLYRLIAKVLRHRIAEDTGDARSASQIKSEIAREVQALESENSAVLETFRRIVPASERTNLGLLD